MAERIYTGPVGKQLRGSREGAKTLARAARAKVGHLFDTMRPGETFKTGAWDIGSGYKVKAFIWDDINGKRVVTRLIAPSSIVGSVKEFWMHHGFYGAGRVYVPKDIEDFFLGTETEGPKGFAGVLEYDGAAYKAGNIPFPALDAEKSYDPGEDLLSMGMPEPILREAYLSSGLGVAFWQAKNGAGTAGNLIGSFPAWMLEPKNITLVRSPEDVFWLVRHNGTSGMHFARMIIPDELITLYGLARSMPEGVERRIAFSYVLGYLAWDGLDPIQILDTESLDPIFDKNALDPFNWGWQWAWQEFGAVDELDAKAVLTVYRQLDCAPIDTPPTCLAYTDAVTISRECLLTIEWVAGIPTTGAIDINESGPWKLFGGYPSYPFFPLLKVWHAVDYISCWGWGGALGHWATRYDACPGDEHASSALLCSWYKKDGSLFRITSYPISFSDGLLEGRFEYTDRAYGGIDFGSSDYRELIAPVYAQDPATLETMFDAGYSGALVFGVVPRTVHFFVLTQSPYFEFGDILRADVEFWLSDYHSDISSVAFDVVGGDPETYGEPYLTQIFYGLPGESRVLFTISQANSSYNENFVSHLVPESYHWDQFFVPSTCGRSVLGLSKETATLIYSDGVTPADGFAPLKWESDADLWPGSLVGAA